MGRPSRPMFGRRGQTKVGASVSGGEPVPKPSPRPPTGKMVPPVEPFPDPAPIRAVAPGGGMPGGPKGDVSETARMPPTDCPLGPGGAPDGKIGPRPPKPRAPPAPRPD